MSGRTCTLAAFVTAHGFGHAARASAVLSALAPRVPGLRVELFTTVPEWFFAASLDLPWRRHPLEHDVGMVQRDALVEDPAATADRLERLLPPGEAWLEERVAELRRLGCTAVLCDISPLGLAVAARAGLPAVLVESFTWDWIYRAYLADEPRLAPLSADIAALDRLATLRLQATPCCLPLPDLPQVPPVARRPRRTVAQTRRALGVPPGERLVLVGMGGIPWSFEAVESAPRRRGLTLVVPGGAQEERRLPGLVLLPHQASHYHPDLVAAADGVIGKLGYSTLAEAWSQGLPFAFVPRPRFPESPVLAAFAERETGGFPVPPEQLGPRGLVAAAERLLGLPRRPPPEADGAAVTAGLVAEHLGG